MLSHLQLASRAAITFVADVYVDLVMDRCPYRPLVAQMPSSAHLPDTDVVFAAQEFGDAPVLVLNDGQNLFDDALSFSGASWRVGATIASMSAAGSLPKCVAVGIDNDGSNRSFDYCPNKPGPGPKVRLIPGRVSMACHTEP